MRIRVYELSQINDGLGGISEEKVLVYEGRGKCVQKDHEIENSPYNLMTVCMMSFYLINYN